MAVQIPKGVLVAAAAITFVAVAIVQRRRGGSAASTKVLETSGSAIKLDIGAAHVGRKAQEAGAKAAKIAAKASTAGSRVPKIAAKMPDVASKAPRWAASLPKAARRKRFGASGRKHKPKSFFRYHAFGLLIGALERDATRRAVIGGLKLAQRRA